MVISFQFRSAVSKWKEHNVFNKSSSKISLEDFQMPLQTAQLMYIVHYPKMCYLCQENVTLSTRLPLSFLPF